MNFNHIYTTESSEEPYDSFMILAAIHAMNSVPGNISVKSWFRKTLKLNDVAFKFLQENRMFSSMNLTIDTLWKVGYAPLAWSDAGNLKIRFVKGMRHVIDSKEMESRVNNFVNNYLVSNELTYQELLDDVDMIDPTYPFADVGRGLTTKFKKLKRLGFPIEVESNETSLTITVYSRREINTTA